MEQSERILIADDDETLGEVLAAALSLADYATDQVSTVESLRSAVESKHWALIVSDTMGVAFGEEAQRFLSELCQLAGTIPVLVMTGSKETAEWAAANLPVASVLAKPFDLDPFLARVAELVPPPASP
jgi:DNA-binding NtrC family response regulator